MQHINGVLELRHVEDAILIPRMDSSLNDSGADEWNRLPVAGLTSCLNQAQLIADFAARCLGEASQAVTAVSEPLDRLCTNSHPLGLYIIFIIGMDRALPVCPKMSKITLSNSG